MQKRKFISIFLLIIFILTINTTIVSAEIVTTNTEKQGPANSWRYSNDNISTMMTLQNYLIPSSSKSSKPSNTTMKGIDISEHNGNINWAKASKKIDYAILRVGYGSNIKSQDDKKFKQNAEACKKYKIPFGVYLYSYAKNTNQAKSEAYHVLRLIKGYHLDFPVYYDLEDNSQVHLGASTKGSIAKVFCNIISNAEYKVGIYANLNWWNNYLTNSSFKNSNWYKWVAQVGSFCTYKGAYQMWQYSFTGKIDGISGYTDMNYWFGPKIKSYYAYATTKPCLSIDKTNINIKLGNNLSKTSKISAKASTGGKINYSSSNSKVATIDKYGKITAKSRGTCSVKATLNADSKVYKTCKVNVTQQVTKLKLNKTNIAIADQTKATSLKLNVYPANANNKKITWTSNNKNIVTVNSSGKLSVKNKGNCTIKCSTTDGSKISTNCKVSVKSIVPTKITAKDEYYLDLGKKIKLNYSIYPANTTNKKVTYTSSDNKVATVDNNGNITAKQEGECTISINSSISKKLTAITDIYVRRMITDIAPTTTNVVTHVGEQKQIQTLILPTNASIKTLKYTSTDKNIATVDDKGIITGINVGSCQIKISTIDGSNKNTYINVEVKDISAIQKTINFAKSKSGLGLKALKKKDKTNTFVDDQWCAMFCQYVLRSTNPTSIATQVSSKSCGSWSLSLKAKGKYHAHGTKYVPKAGDLVFFTYTGAKGAQSFLNHIGLITNYNPKTYMIKTIEGNTNGNGIYTTKVAEKEYFINNTKINGFGEVDYN